MRISYLYSIIGCTYVIAAFAQELPEPYRSTRLLPYDDHGWFMDSNQKGLERIINELQPRVVVELGSWLGLSTVFIAERLSKGATVYAVDNWNQVGSSPGVRNNPLSRSKLSTLYQSFLSNIVHKSMTHVVVPIRMDTLEAARALDVTPQLIYIDASHEEEDVYNDIIHWYPRLAVGGVMCGDDWASLEPVRRGVTRAAKELNQHITGTGNFWCFRVKS